MKRQMLIALFSAALMLGMSTSANCEEEENVILSGLQESNIVIQTDELLPDILDNLSFEQIQILDIQEMKESKGADPVPPNPNGECRPRPHC